MPCLCGNNECDCGMLFPNEPCNCQICRVSLRKICQLCNRSSETENGVESFCSCSNFSIPADPPQQQIDNLTPQIPFRSQWVPLFVMLPSINTHSNADNFLEDVDRNQEFNAPILLDDHGRHSSGSSSGCHSIDLQPVDGSPRNQQPLNSNMVALGFVPAFGPISSESADNAFYIPIVSELPTNQVPTISGNEISSQANPIEVGTRNVNTNVLRNDAFVNSDSLPRYPQNNLATNERQASNTRNQKANVSGPVSAHFQKSLGDEDSSSTPTELIKSMKSFKCDSEVESKNTNVKIHSSKNFSQSRHSYQKETNNSSGALMHSPKPQPAGKVSGASKKVERARKARTKKAISSTTAESPDVDNKTGKALRVGLEHSMLYDGVCTCELCRMRFFCILCQSPRITESRLENIPETDMCSCFIGELQFPHLKSSFDEQIHNPKTDEKQPVVSKEMLCELCGQPCITNDHFELLPESRNVCTCFVRRSQHPDTNSNLVAIDRMNSARTENEKHSRVSSKTYASGTPIYKMKDEDSVDHRTHNPSISLMDNSKDFPDPWMASFGLGLTQNVYSHTSHPILERSLEQTFQDRSAYFDWARGLEVERVRAEDIPSNEASPYAEKHDKGSVIVGLKTVEKISGRFNSNSINGCTNISNDSNVREKRVKKWLDSQHIN